MLGAQMGRPILVAAVEIVIGQLSRERPRVRGTVTAVYAGGSSQGDHTLQMHLCLWMGTRDYKCGSKIGMTAMNRMNA